MKIMRKISKKIFAFVLAFSLLVGSFPNMGQVVSAAGAPAANRTIYLAEAAPTIDGAIDDIWDGKIIVPIDQQVASEGLSNNTTTMGFMCDEDNFYMIAEVVDGDPGKSGDILDLYFDYGNEKTAASNTASVGQIQILQSNPSNPTFSGNTGRNFDFKGMDIKSSLVEGGYVIEAKIPWSAMKNISSTSELTGRPKEMGIMIQAKDSDGTSTTKTRKGLLGTLGGTDSTTSAHWPTFYVETVVVPELEEKTYDFTKGGDYKYSAGAKGDYTENGWVMKAVGFTPSSKYPDVATTGGNVLKFDSGAIENNWVDIAINVPVSGTYDVTFISAVVASSETTTGTVSIGNVSAVIDSKIGVGQTDWQKVNVPMGGVELVEGENVFRIAKDGEGFILLAGIKIVPPDETEPPSGGIAVDGDIADWKDVSFMNLKEEIVGVSNNIAKTAITADKDNLYIAVDVKDEVIISNASDGSPWGINDAVELYLNFEDDLTGTGYGAKTWQIGITAGTSLAFAGGQSGNKTGTLPTNTIVSSKKIDGGYVIEAAIPWSSIGVPYAKKAFSANVYVSDTDAASATVCQISGLAPAPVGAGSWVNPSAFKKFMLDPVVSPVVSPVVELPTKVYDFGTAGDILYSGGWDVYHPTNKGNYDANGWVLENIGFPASTNSAHPNVATTGGVPNKALKLYTNKDDKWVDIAINVPVAGTYKVTALTAVSAPGEIGAGKLTLGGVSTNFTSEMATGQSPMQVVEVSMGEISLTAGKNILRMEITKGIAVLLKGIKISSPDGVEPSPPAEEVEYNFKAAPTFTTWVEGGVGDYDANGWRISALKLRETAAVLTALRNNQSYGLEFAAGYYGNIDMEINVPGDGKYIPTLTYATSTYASEGSTVSINGQKVIKGLVFQSGKPSQGLTVEGVEIDLKAGKNILNFRLDEDSKSMYLTSFKLTPATEGPPPVFPEIDTTKPMIYDFKKLTTGDITTKFWGNEKASKGCKFDETIFGLKLNTDSKNGNPVLTMKIYIPEDGLYIPTFKGYQSEGGGKYDLSISGSSIGEFQFFHGTTDAYETNVLTPVTLKKGLQEFKLVCRGKSDHTASWGDNAYLTELQLLLVKDNASLATSTKYKGDIYAGRTEQLITEINIAGNLFAIPATSYVSENSAIATVDSNGMIKAVSTGTTKITAKFVKGSLNLSSDFNVTVDARTVDTVSVALEKTKIPDNIKTTATTTATVTGGEAVKMSDCTIKYSSSNTAIATVDEKTGVVTPVKGAIGTVDVISTVTLGATTKTGSSTLQVVPLALEKIEATIARQNIFIDQKVEISVLGYKNDGAKQELTNDQIIYSANSAEFVTIKDGIVTGIKAGKTIITITAKVGEITATATVVCTVADPATAEATKDVVTIYTEEDRKNAKDNIAKYDWAKASASAAVSAAGSYVGEENAEWLWNIVTSQLVPRAFAVSVSAKSEQNICPGCDKYLPATNGQYPWRFNVKGKPWKVICPQCSQAFPTNDFEAYYKGGIGDNGFFDPTLAKEHNDELIANGGKGNLVNLSDLHADDPTWGVDNGYGWKNPADKIYYHFVAHYNHWAIYYAADASVIERAITSLKDAYLYTGDEKYAINGIILLDRIADVYPDMNIKTMEPGNTNQDKYRNSHGGAYEGKVIGGIWECMTVQEYIRAFDAFYPEMNNPKVIEFLQAKASKYNMDNPKASGGLIAKNIEDNIVRMVYPEVKSAKIFGNTGMHQAALALAAVCIDSEEETKEWLDFTFQAGGRIGNPGTYVVTGGDIGATLVNKINRDGFGTEVAPGYNTLWVEQLKMVADVLDGYEGYAGGDLYANPKFIKMFSAYYPMYLCQKYFAQIGDSGNTGGIGSLPFGAQMFVEAFAKSGDPILAQLAYYQNGRKTEGIHIGIFDKNPEAIGSRIKEVINTEGELDFASENLTAYGFTVLRGGTKSTDSGGTTLAFKNMKYTKTEGIDVKLFPSGIQQFQAELKDAGAFVEFTFEVEKENSYNIYLTPFAASSYGIYDILIDGVKAKDGFNFYTCGTTPVSIAEKALTVGTHTIRFENARPHTDSATAATSTALKMGVSMLTLYNPAEMEIINMGKNVDTQRDVWMHYGANSGHGHRDSMNLGMHAYGLDVAPDNGYVTDANPTPRRTEWELNTISHNTVVVNSSQQNSIESDTSGTPMHYDGGGKVQVIDADMKEVYSETSMYRRTLINVNVGDSDSYTVDLFRVKGGYEHLYSFHGADGAVTTNGLSLVKQEAGTYAGTNVEFGVRPASDSSSGWGYKGGGYHWLRDVQKQDNPTKGFSVEWDLADGRNVLNPKQDIRLRLTMLNEVDDVALANGEPPVIAGNPKELTYLLARNKGTNLETTFTSVIEPYNGTRFIKSIEEVAVVPADADVKAIKVTMVDGRVDYIVNALDNTKTYRVDDKFDFKGFVGVCTENVAGKQVYGYINDGTKIGDAVAATDSITGTVAGFTETLNQSNEITLTVDQAGVDYTSLIGRDIYVEKTGKMNGTYRILGVKSSDGKTVTFDLGSTTLIQSYKDAANLNGGYNFTIANGNKFRIPLSIEFYSPAPTDILLSGQSIDVNSAVGSTIATITVVDANNDADLIEVLVGGDNFKIVGNKLVLAKKLGCATYPISIKATDAVGNTITKAFSITITDSTIPVDPGKPPVDPIDPPVDPEKPLFSDIENHYAKNAAIALSKAGVIKGYDDGTARLENNAMRSEFVSMVARALKLTTDAKPDFSDIDATGWYAADLAAVVEKGLVVGSGDGKFRPSENITRQEVMVIISKAIDSLGIESKVDESVLDSFDDAGSIAGWARNDVAKLVGLGIVKGSGNKINATAKITRGEICIILNQILEMVNAK